jgi:flagella basal body P-ring formation protein FlgA
MRNAFAFALFALAPAIAAERAHAQSVEDPATIAHVAESFVRRELPESARDAARVRAARLDARLRLAPCATPLEADWSAGAALRARTSVQVACRSGAAWRINVPVTIHSALDVLVLTAPASRGRSLTAADVAPRRVEVEGLAHLYIRSLGELAGRHLARPAPAGVPLPLAWFAPDRIVKRGQAVTLVAAAEGIRIRAPGRALADGTLGGRVRVQNLSSLKVVEGVVENDSEVRVSR